VPRKNRRHLRKPEDGEKKRAPAILEQGPSPAEQGLSFNGLPIVNELRGECMSFCVEQRIGPYKAPSTPILSMSHRRVQPTETPRDFADSAARAAALAGLARPNQW